MYGVFWLMVENLLRFLPRLSFRLMLRMQLRCKMTALYMSPCVMQFHTHSYDYIHKAFAGSVKRLYTYFKPYITVSYLCLCETLEPLLRIIVGYSSVNSIVVFFFFRHECSLSYTKMRGYFVTVCCM